MTIGCIPSSGGGIKSSDVKNITLECIQICLEKIDPPFTKKQFEDRGSIDLFIKAVNHAKKMQGVLDYGAIFLMTITMNDESQMEYHFNIENTDNPQKGLILKLPNTEQGYEISEETSEKLKHMIYVE